MSEPSAAYVPCAAGNNAFADCLVEKHGDLIRMVGHPMMDFLPAEARLLAQRILELAGESVDRMTPLEFSPAESSGDPIVDRVRVQLLERSRAGQLKYRHTLMRDDLDLLDWIVHAAEENLDAALYLTRVAECLKHSVDDGK